MNDATEGDGNRPETAEQVIGSNSHDMTLLDFGRVLLARPDAVSKFAANPHLLKWLSLFVVSAGLAREYDQEYLLREPWYAFIPLAASVIASLLLYLTLSFVLKAGNRCSPKGYASFLTLFWTTSPLAWLYAVPYERFMQPDHALAAGVYTLGFVALWRVLWMTSVSAQFFGRKRRDTLSVTVFYSYCIVFVILAFTELPLIAFMGGVRHTRKEEFILAVVTLVWLTGIPLFLTSLIHIVYQLLKKAPAPVPETLRDSPRRKASFGFRALAVSSVLAFVAALAWTQPEQALRYRFQSAYDREDYEVAADLLATHRLEDFPPGYDLPPRMGYADPAHSVLPLLELLLMKAPTSEFTKKYRDLFIEQPRRIMDPTRWNAQRVSVIHVLEQLNEPELLEVFKSMSGYEIIPHSVLREKQEAEFLELIKKVYSSNHGPFPEQRRP